MSRHATRQVADSFGSRLRSARLAAALTQEAVARAVGCNLRQVQRWEDGSSEPRGSQIAALALALGVSVADLFPDSQEAA